MLNSGKALATLVGATNNKRFNPLAYGAGQSVTATFVQHSHSGDHNIRPVTGPLEDT